VTDGKDDQSPRQIRRRPVIDADLAQIQFSPEVVRSFARLAALVSDSKDFSQEIRENLEELASGKPYPVHTALTEMALITRETMDHIHATGDQSARKALDQLISNVMGVGFESRPVAVLAPNGRGR
jgi:hypothetical protein